MNTIKRVLLRGVLIALGLTGLPALVEGVLVAPHAIFIDHRTRTGQVHLLNTGSEPEEVEIQLQFGYPDTDPAGNIFVRLIEDPDSGAPSAASWIRAFPRRLMLPPGGRQVVRLLATPPADLPDGEYWSRLIVTSRGGHIAMAGGDSTVSAGVTLEIRTIISVTYRKGEIQTGINVTELDTRVVNDSLIAWLGLERSGNGAFLGQVTFDLRNARDSSVASWPTPIAVYYPLRRRFSFPLDGIAPGAYTLRFTLNTDRDDLDASTVLPADPIEQLIPIQIPQR
jgi:hypothetical protein